MHYLPPRGQATLLAHSLYTCAYVLVCAYMYVHIVLASCVCAFVCVCVHVHAVDMEMCVPLVPSSKTKCVLGDARIGVREFQLKKEISQIDFWNGEMAS